MKGGDAGGGLCCKGGVDKSWWDDWICLLLRRLDGATRVLFRKIGMYGGGCEGGMLQC